MKEVAALVTQYHAALVSGEAANIAALRQPFAQSAILLVLCRPHRQQSGAHVHCKQLLLEVFWWHMKTVSCKIITKLGIVRPDTVRHLHNHLQAEASTTAC